MTQTERELVSRARAGDTAAFEQLMLDNQDRVYTLCLRMTGDREDALDLAQETFFNAWRGLSSFQGNSSFSTWVYRLASNACIDFLRKRKRRQQGESPHSLDDEEAPLPEPADPRGSPEEELERRELRRAVERGLTHLASLGVEDYGNEVFTQYASRLFPFQEVRAEMAYLQGKGQKGKANLKRFLDGMLVLAEED